MIIPPVEFDVVTDESLTECYSEKMKKKMNLRFYSEIVGQMCIFIFLQFYSVEYSWIPISLITLRYGVVLVGDTVKC